MSFLRRTVKIRDAVKGRNTVSYEKKEELRGMRCASCHQIFDMGTWCNDDKAPGLLTGTFDKTSQNQGNMFSCFVCSFKCAHDIFTGGWKKFKECSEFVQGGSELVRVELGLTTIFKDEQTLINEWEARTEIGPNETMFVNTTIRGSGTQGKLDRLVENLSDVIAKHR